MNLQVGPNRCRRTFAKTAARVREGQQNKSRMEESMPTFVLPLVDPDAMLNVVGGKGVPLAKMAGTGLFVPDVFM